MNWLHRDGLGDYLNEAGLRGVGVEVGARAGAFAATVLKTWRGWGLTLIDPWEAQPRSVYADSVNDPVGIAADHAAAARLAQSDTRVGLLRAYSPAAAGHFADGSLDWVYVDANHSRAPAWGKVRFIQEELAQSDWVFWSDADALVMDASVPLSRFVQDSVDVVLSGDPYNGINCGHLFVKNSPWSMAFLDRVW